MVFIVIVYFLMAIENFFLGYEFSNYFAGVPEYGRALDVCLGFLFLFATFLSWFFLKVRGPYLSIAIFMLLFTITLAVILIQLHAYPLNGCLHPEIEVFFLKHDSIIAGLFIIFLTPAFLRRLKQ